MKTSMSLNSLIAYDHANIGKHKKLILHVLNCSVLNAKEISDVTGIAHSTVCGRLNDLRYKNGLIVEDHVSNVNGHPVSYYRRRKINEDSDKREPTDTEVDLAAHKVALMIANKEIEEMKKVLLDLGLNQWGERIVEYPFKSTTT